MEKLLRRELVYSVSETSLWGRFLLSLKKLKYEVRGRAADNPPEVEKCKVLTANSIYLLQKHHRPLALDAWATLTGRSFETGLLYWSGFTGAAHERRMRMCRVGREKVAYEYTSVRGVVRGAAPHPVFQKFQTQ